MEGELERLLERQHSVISRGQALRVMSAGAIQRRVAARRWQRPHRGVYVAHSGPIDRPQRRWVAVLGAVPTRRVPLGGLSALETAGFRGLPDERIHVLVPAATTPRSLPGGVVAHRTSLLRPGDVHPLGDPPGTRPARSLVDAAQWAATDRQARAIVAAGFQQRMVRVPEMMSVLAVMPRARRRALIVEAVTDGGAGAHSVAEMDFLRICRHGALPDPELQAGRRDSAGRRRYLDAYFTGYGIHVEIDGGGHLDPRQWWADMRRQNDLWIAGDRVLRFPAWVVRSDPAEILRQVRQALSAAGWTPPAESPCGEWI